LTSKKHPFLNCYSTFLFLFLVQAILGSWMFSSSLIWLLALPQAALTLFLILKPQQSDNINLPVILTLVTIAGCVSPLIRVFELQSESPEWFLWLFVVAQLIMIWESMSSWSRINTDHKPLLGNIINLIVPFLFGASLIYIWEILTVGFNVPQILLPSPHLIALAFAKSTSVLWADFQQTFVKAVLSGYLMGCGSGFLVAILIDRVPFLQKGLLPLGNLVSALPIVGVAPIMVMWFGFDWQSKAAVVVIMTFFPMLVNTLTGIASTGHMERDLMYSYASNYSQSLLLLRLPNALPFIFNALKINSTLALIGAIVAEFFGTPIVGMGFRISIEVGRMNVDVVWATITVAALSGSLFYALIALCERRLTSWHPSLRKN
jgi:NitT/TauT family transport system permease protein|tara:strand:- start:1061 stop:2188 length:1128 start_codon:yes stop_codon:yes gene_type:complete